MPIRVYGHSGVREMDALLDTGAFLVSIPPEDATDLGYSLDTAPLISVGTANGVIQAPNITLSRIRLGEFDETDVLAICLDIAEGGISSLLGLSLLGRFKIVIDPTGKTLSILNKNHYDVKLPAEDLHRLTLWLDLCSIFYGVYEKAGGEAQLRGEVVRPTLE